jgi:ribosomal protein L7/L12
MEWMAPAVVFVGVIAIWVSVTQMQGRLERAERKLNALLRHFNIEPAQGSLISERVKELARDPKHKIEAIKLHREETGVSLVEAKQAVEEFINSI